MSSDETNSEMKLWTSLISVSEKKLILAKESRICNLKKESKIPNSAKECDYKTAQKKGLGQLTAIAVAAPKIQEWIFLPRTPQPIELKSHIEN